MYHDVTFVSTESGLARLADYLNGPRNRVATLSATWPIVLAPVAAPDELRAELPGDLRSMKRIGHEPSEGEEAVFSTHNPFASLTRQFEEVARRLCAHLEAPEFAIDYFWHRSETQIGRPQFINWHTDGDVTVRTDDGSTAVEHCENFYPALVNGRDFSPNCIFLQATLELPTIFASRITTDFDRGIYGYRRKDGRQVPVLEEARLKAWLDENATMTQAPVGHIIAFPSGVLHSGAPAREQVTRTIVVARLRIKPRGQECHT